MCVCVCVSLCCAALLCRQVRMAEDLDFKYPMKMACAVEINTFCKDIPHGHARLIRCVRVRVCGAGLCAAH